MLITNERKCTFISMYVSIAHHCDEILLVFLTYRKGFCELCINERKCIFISVYVSTILSNNDTWIGIDALDQIHDVIMNKFLDQND